MKHYSLFSIALFALNCSPVFAEEASVQDPIVNIKQAVEFGIWKIYNSGDDIYFIDKENANATTFLKVDLSDSTPIFSNADEVFFLSNDGTSSTGNFVASSGFEAAKEGLATQISAHIQDGRYGFGESRFVVNGDNITIFNIENEDMNNPGSAVPATVLKKFSNGLVHTGTETSTIFDPTVVLDANDIPGPAAILGDCVATYSPETGKVVIPCLSVEGDNTVYRVGQQQVPGGLTFEVDPADVSRVQ